MNERRTEGDSAVDVHIVGAVTFGDGRTLVTRSSDRRTVVQGPGKEEGMPEEGYEPLDREALQKLAGEELPERAVQSLINANVAAPINAALALNVASDHAVAVADAEQVADIRQTT